MRKHEIKRKFDEIVDFSGVERYIDTPVKRYSSGMYVRLAFAVAAYLESEILIVDEVLAVGDSEFQKKCLGKMNDVTKNDGRTVLFVSHNLIAVKSLCNKSILLENGENIFLGNTQDVINLYEQNGSSFDNLIKFSEEDLFGDECAKFKLIKIFNSDDENSNIFYREDPVDFSVEYEVMVEDEISISIHINQGSQCVFVSGNDSLFQKKGIYKIDGKIPAYLLSNLTYSISFFIVRRSRIIASRLESIFYFNVGEKNKYVTNVMGLIRPNISWQKPQII
jgi:lipopolysaccharide transport system ATP-binding protein